MPEPIKTGEMVGCLPGCSDGCAVISLGLVAAVYAATVFVKTVRRAKR